MANNLDSKYEFLADDPTVKTIPIMISLIIGAFFAVLNETLLNIALVTLMEEFQITLPTVQWMVTGFMLVMGIVIPISALFVQWFTTRQLFISVMIIFTIGTTISAMAPNFSLLLVGRLIQAIGTGLLMPIIFNVFLLLYPPEKRGKIMGLVGLVFMFAPAIGPTLSGIIVEYLGWRYLFISVIPFTLFSIVFAYKYLINVGEVTKPKIDTLSILFSSVGFGAIIYGFSSAGESKDGFLTPSVYMTIVIGVISVLFFSIRQFKLKDPVMDLRVFSYPMYTHAVFMFLIIIMGMFASELILPIFMQGPLALTAAAAGLVLLPGSILNGAMSPLMGHLFDKFGPRILMIPATIVLSGTMFMMSQLTENTPIWIIIIGYILLMLSVSAIMMPAQTNGLNQLPKALYPHGTAVMTTLQPVAGAIGVSVFISMMNARQLHFLQNASNPEHPHTINQAMVAGVELVYFISFIMAIIAVILALTVYRASPTDNSRTTDTE